MILLAKALTARGWQTPIVTLGDGPFTQLCKEQGFKTIPLDVPSAPLFTGPLWSRPLQLSQSWRYQRQVLPKLETELRSLGADAVHFLRPNLVALAGSAARGCGIPCFWEMVNVIGNQYPFGLNRKLYQWLCWRNGVLPLANSFYTARTLGDRLVQPEVMHLSADPARFDPENLESISREEIGIPDDAVVLGILGRLVDDKGQRRVLEAMASLKQTDGPEVHLLLVGGPLDTPYTDGLREYAEQRGMTDRLHFTGLVSNPECYYEIIDIAINSRITAEPFGLSVVEAMMMGRPVLVHALGGPAETVVDGVTGWHVNDPSVESFAAGIKRALKDRSRWPTMREQSREHAMKLFTCQIQAQRYEDIVLPLLNSRR